MLRQLIETSYSRQLGKHSVEANQYQVTFTDERTRNHRVTVEASLAVRGDAHVIELKLMNTGAGFIAYDIVTDDVSRRILRGELREYHHRARIQRVAAAYAGPSRRNVQLTSGNPKLRAVQAKITPESISGFGSRPINQIVGAALQGEVCNR